MTDDKSRLTPAQRKSLEDFFSRRAERERKAKEDELYAADKYDALTKRLRGIYAEAARDLEAKTHSFNARHERNDKKYRQQVAAGIITEEDYKAWKYGGQVFQSEDWRKRREQMAKLLVNADKQAADMINRATGNVFCESANYLEYQLEQDAGGDLNFGLFNEEAFEYLVMEDPQMLPRPEIEENKDFAWYNRVIQDAVIQGILQGESLDDITMRIANDTFEKSITAMRRHARTAFTGAMSAGREAAMRDALNRGISMKKMWDAYLDGDTRDAHQKLDGKEAEVGEAFMSPLGPIRYPGDPTARPENVYNCRCRLRYVHPKYPEVRHRFDEDGVDVGSMKYLEWKAWKAGRGEKA